MMRLNELGVLSQVARISSVSGGQIASGYLACAWNQLGTQSAAGVFSRFQEIYVEPMLAFSREKIGIGDIVHGLLPWRSAAEQVAAGFDRSLFRNITLQDIPDTPRFVFCATNMQTGVLFRFSKSYAGDYLIGRIDRPTALLSTAVAARQLGLRRLRSLRPRSLQRDPAAVAGAEMAIPRAAPRLRRRRAAESVGSGVRAGVTAVVTHMGPSQPLMRAPVAGVAQVELDGADRDIETGLSLQAQRLQGKRIGRAAHQRIGIAADADSRARRDAAIGAGEIARADQVGRRENGPAEHGSFREADVETGAMDDAVVAISGAVVGLERARQLLGGTDDEAGRRGAAAFEHAGLDSGLRSGGPGRGGQCGDPEGECGGETGHRIIPCEKR